MQALFGNGYFADMVFEDPAWDFRTLNFGSDVAFADATTAGIFNSNSPDLSRFKARGGKLIQWHGFEDPAISPRDSIRYYESVVATQSSTQNARDENGLNDTQQFYRLFMAPGVLHCGGGPGPNNFDVLPALVNWVEKGVAPERIQATKFNGDNPANGIATTRPLCVYPAVATYKATATPTTPRISTARGTAGALATDVRSLVPRRASESTRTSSGTASRPPEERAAEAWPKRT